MSEKSDLTRKRIEERLRKELDPLRIEIEDETWKHEGHAASGGGGHFKLLVVSDRFSGLSLISRNRLVFDMLKDLMQTDIHALSVKARTVQECEP